MANSIRNIRSGFVQARYNERLAKILSYELAYASLIGASLLAYWFGWQWFFWGIILLPVILAIGLSIPIVADVILIVLGLFWALPFIFLGALGINAFYVGAVIAFVISIWVHSKGMTWFADLGRWD
jgi:hypothetical protein